VIEKREDNILQLNNEEITWLKQHPIIDIGVDGNWPPYDFIDTNGQHSGLAHDFMDNIAAQLDIKFKPVPGPTFGKMLDKVKQGDLKIAAAITQTPERNKELWFSDLFVTVHKVIIARKDNPYFQKPEDLFGKVVAIEEGFSAIEILKKLYPEIKIKQVATTLDALQEVSWGKADAYIGNGAVVQWLIQQHQLNNIEFKGDAKLGPTPQRFAIHKDKQWQIFVGIINKALANIDTKQRNKMYQQWLGNANLSEQIFRNLKLNEQEYEWLRSHADIRLGIDASWPPIEFLDNKGQYQGISSEFMKIISDTLDLNILAIEKLSWDEVLNRAEKKQLDVIPALAKTRERDKYLNFTKSYLNFPFVIFVRNTQPHTTVLADLYGKKVVVEKAYVTRQDLTRDHPDIIQIPVNNTREALEKVSLGQADAYVGNLTVGSYLITRYGFNNLKVGGTTEYSYDLTIGVRKDWPELVTILDKFLDTLSAEEKSKIRQKWLSIQYDLEVDDALIQEIIIVAAILVFISLLWGAYIKRENSHLLRSEQQLNKIIDTMPLAIAIMDNTGKITRVNTRVAKEFNSTNETALGRSIEDFFDVPEEKQVYLQRIEKKGTIYEMQVNFRKGDGDVVTGLLSIIAIDLGKKQIRLGVFVNLTERIKMEQALKKAKEESERANEVKSHFLANMSHEIRTPMNAIIGMAYLALQTNLTDKQFDYISKVKLSADHLLGIINDILDFSKIEAGMLSLEKIEFKLDDVLDHLADIVNLKASEKDIEILFSRDLLIPEGLVGDPLRLEQVLINLVQNAIKFTEVGEIVVSSELINDKNGIIKIAFSVKDSGIGIQPEKLKHLFAAFMQADSSISRKHGGTGLGLSISKQLVEMMDGQLTVASEPGKGSIFSFTVMLEKQRYSVTKLSEVKPDLQGSRVLVVDDNPVALKISKEMLESLSFDVEAVSSARQAYQLLADNNADNPKQTNPFDVILMDWRMPEVNGVEAIKHIHSKLSLSRMPKIILITAYGREDLLKEAENIQMDGLLSKPISASTLLDSIMNTMNKNVAVRKVQSSQLFNTSDRQLKGRILLTEDNTINQQVARELLENFGLLVVIAENGQKAVDYVHNNDFDLVLMDLQMPVMDGLQATRLIRQEQKFKHLPVIAMTAHAMEGDKEHCLTAGMDDYLSKPIDPEKLHQMMLKWLDEGLVNKGSHNVDFDQVDVELDESLSAIDLRWGLQRVGGNKTLFARLLQDFKNKYEHSAVQLRQYLESHELEEARRLAHTIHGVAGNIGARKFQHAAQKIETAIRANNINDDYLLPLVDDFAQQARTIFTELDELNLQWQQVSTENADSLVETGDIKPGNNDELHAMLKQLDELLLEGDSEAQTVMKSVQEMFLARQLLDNDQLLLSMAQQINDYEYDEARESLQELNSFL